MRLRSRLMLFFLVIVLGPAAGGVFMGRQMAERQSTARADGRLEGASIAVVHALNQQVAQAMQRLTASVALRAVAGGASVDALHRVRMGAGLDYLVVVRRGHVVAADLRPATFRPGVSVSAATLAGGPAQAGLVSDYHVLLAGQPSTAVWGGLFRDQAFLRTLGTPGLTVGSGRVAASSAPVSVPPTSIEASGPSGLAGGWRELCVCTGAGSTRTGIVIVGHPARVGAFTAFGPLTLLVLIAAMLLAVLLGFRMAGLVAGPVTRLAEEATASLPDDVVIIPETSDEVSQIDEALAALRTGLRQTTDELGGSREELRVTKERLDDQERLVLTDGLTGVWNRRYLEMALSDALQRGQRRKRPFAVLMVDLDHFKKVNDTYGHQRGDDVLVELCRRIRSSLRTHLDVLARYGGEEFVILLPETNPQGAFIVAQKIRRLVRAEPFGEGEDGLRVTVSIGLSSYPGDGEDHEQLLAIADANLYRAKGAGRDRVMTGATSPES